MSYVVSLLGVSCVASVVADAFGVRLLLLVTWFVYCVLVSVTMGGYRFYPEQYPDLFLLWEAGQL